MRKIKFRFWNKVTKSLHYPDGWDEIASRMRLVEMIPMQFTGLKDKNGKEIFEGDVLKWKDYGRRSYRIYLIIWSEENATFDLDTIKDSSRNSVPDDRIYRTDTEAEIIGNIYENPELLNECVEDSGGEE